MALIKCQECGREISNKSPACPGCGCPFIASAKTLDEVLSGNKLLQKIRPGLVSETKKLLSSDENVLFSAIMNISTRPIKGKLDTKIYLIPKNKENGLLTITDKRVLFVNVMLGIGNTKQILIKDISSIDSTRSIGLSPVRIQGLTEMFVIDSKKEEQVAILNALNASR